MGALVTAAVIGAAGTAFAASKQAGAAGKGANAQITAAQIAADEQRAAREQARQDNMPWLQAGQNALGLQQKFLAGDTSGFENSAGYRFALDQGFKGLNRGLAAEGALTAPAADSDRIAYGQGLASQFADSYYAKLAGLSNTGAGTASNLGALGQNAANAIGQNYLAAGNARAAGYANQANAYANAANSLGQLGSAVVGYFGNQQQPANSTPPVNYMGGGGQLGGYSQWAQSNFPQSGFMGRTS